MLCRQEWPMFMVSRDLRCINYIIMRYICRYVDVIVVNRAWTILSRPQYRLMCQRLRLIIIDKANSEHPLISQSVCVRWYTLPCLPTYIVRICRQGNKEALVISQSANNESRSDDNIILGRHSDIADCWGSKNMYSTLYAQDIA